MAPAAGRLDISWKRVLVAATIPVLGVFGVIALGNATWGPTPPVWALWTFDFLVIGLALAVLFGFHKRQSAPGDPVR